MRRSLSDLVAGVFSRSNLRWSDMTMSNIILLICLHINLVYAIYLIKNEAETFYYKFNDLDQERSKYLIAEFILMAIFELLRVRLGYIANQNQFPELCAFVRLTMLLLIPVCILVLWKNTLTLVSEVPLSPVPYAALLCTETAAAYALVTMLRHPFNIALEMWKIRVD